MASRLALAETPFVTAEILPAAKRARGRPRKTVHDRDDGNRRLALVRAAATLFRRKGFAATSTRDIADAVGMGSGSPFYHFTSKSALLCEVMRQGMEEACVRQAVALEKAIAPAFNLLSKEELQSATERWHLAVLIKNHFEILLAEGADFIPVMLYEWRSLNARQREQIARIKDEYEALWMPVLLALQKAGALHADARVARLLIFGALNWAVQWYDPKFKGDGGMDLDALTAQAMALFTQKDLG